MVESDEAKRLTGNDKKMHLLKKTKKGGEKIENSKSLLKKFLSENLNQLFCSQKTSYDTLVRDSLSHPSHTPPQGRKEECPSKRCV